MNTGKGLFTLRTGLLVLAVCAMNVGPVAFAGGDDCGSATVTIVPVGSSGSPITTTVFGDSSTATGPDFCLPGGSDLGWYEAFEIDTCATVTIDFCGTDPTSRPSWSFLYDACPCSGGISANSFDRFAPCTDFNLWLKWDMLNPGTYWYPVYAVPGDKRCENGPLCSSDDDCTPPYTCQDNLHPYTIHITAEAAGASAVAQVSFAEAATHETSPVAAVVAASTGPDLIVGRVFQCQQLGHEGTPGSGTVGMSCYTTACTIGDEGTDWYGLPDVNHPMISVNLFRLSSQDGSDRLMQLGQSWLKHGFGTENANDCGFGCTPGGHFNLNNPGCSDTYAACQFVPCDMGPRSMINPYTGVMPSGSYQGPAPGCSPPITCGRETEVHPANDHRDHVHNGISHRLQVLDVDLDPAMNPGAEYFAEGQYLTPHEFVAGNGTQNNNVSYRHVTVDVDGCGRFLFSEVGDTNTEQPAIDAWAGASQTLIEPAPLEDGRGFLVYKVTDLGNDVWHYEYALYNMNMDRAMGSLSIPLDPDAVVSNIGFYAPLNHAPEAHTVNYDNDPWSVSVAGGAITWSTDAFGDDPFANAVRFGTMYNFWFDADRPPQPTNAMVGLFKTGGTEAAVTIGPSAPAPPPGVVVWDPATNPGPWPNENPEAALRALRFRVNAPATATGTPGQDAIKITVIDLQHPDPRNLPQFPPQNFSTFDTGTHGTCAGGDFAGHHCDDDGDCLRATAGGVDGTCTLPGPACTAAGEANGCARWVGRPGTFYESQGPPLTGPYRAARLQCSPFYWDWTSEPDGLVTVVGAEILPSSEYSVQTYASSCKGVETGCANVSTAVTMYTRRYGDLDAPYNPGSTPITNQPNAIDVAQVVNKFKNATGSPGHYKAQNQPNLPELNSSVNAMDIVTVVDGTKSYAYSFTGPCACPSTVTCGGSCAGCPGMCVKTCSGGDNDGEPCINNNHCPSGACAAVGTCRDRCGRCTP